MTQKWLKSDSQSPTPEWPQSDPKLTQKWLQTPSWVIFESLLGHFGVTQEWDTESHAWESSWVSGYAIRTPHKRFSKMISLNAKNLESVFLAEPHVAVMLSCRTLSAKVCCRTLQSPNRKPWNRRKIVLPNPGMSGPNNLNHIWFLLPSAKMTW